MNGFIGWPDAATALLAGLIDDNRADAWDARHEAVVRGPTLALAAALGDEFGPVRVFRPRVNRRFRPDAPPLRTDTGGIARSPGGSVRAVVLTATSLSVTVGHRRFDAGQVRRYRAAVGGDGASGTDRDRAGVEAVSGVDPGGGSVAPPFPAGGDADGVSPDGGGCHDRSPVDLTVEGGRSNADGPDPGAVLTDVLAEMADAGLAPDPVGELRGRPRGWDARHPRIALLRRCGLQVGRAWEVGPWLATPEPLGRVREAWRAAAPLLDWLDWLDVGPPDPVRPRPRQARPVPAAAEGGVG